MFTLLSVWFGAQLCILFHIYINEYSSIVSNFIEEIGQHIFIKLCLQTKWLTGPLFHSIKMHIVHRWRSLFWWSMSSGQWCAINKRRSYNQFYLSQNKSVDTIRTLVDMAKTKRNNENKKSAIKSSHSNCIVRICDDTFSFESIVVSAIWKICYWNIVVSYSNTFTIAIYPIPVLWDLCFFEL